MLKKFVKGLFWGALAGGTAGLLLAPRSGRETCEKIADSLNDAAETTDEISQQLQQLNVSVANLRQTAATLLPQTLAETKKMVADFQFQAEPRILQINDQIKKIQEHLPEK